jgi:hypothetical protein
MASAVYILGALVSLICAALLLRGYTRGRKQLLLWSGLCFLGLAVSNALVFLDLVVFTNIDLYFLRLGTTTVAMALMLYGLIWESN